MMNFKCFPDACSLLFLVSQSSEIDSGFPWYLYGFSQHTSVPMSRAQLTCFCHVVGFGGVALLDRYATQWNVTGT